MLSEQHYAESGKDSPHLPWDRSFLASTLNKHCIIMQISPKCVCVSSPLTAVQCFSLTPISIIEGLHKFTTVTQGSAGRAFTHNSRRSKAFSGGKYCASKGKVFFFIVRTCVCGYAVKRWSTEIFDHACMYVTSMEWLQFCHCKRFCACAWEFASTLESENTSGSSTVRQSSKLKDWWLWADWESLQLLLPSLELLHMSFC